MRGSVEAPPTEGHVRDAVRRHSFFIVEGFAKVVLAVTVRPLPNWGWVLVSCLVGIGISIYLIANPALSLLALGLVIGIQLISEGVAIGWMAWNIRKT